MITGTTRVYAIVGDPVAHVRTPTAFNAYFAAHGIDAVCVAIQIGRDDLKQAWGGLLAMRNLDGFIVTAPHKTEAAWLCNRLEGDAVHARVANTIRREQDGSLTGTLLDGRGFVAGLRAAGHEPRGCRAYIAGAGGAGTAIAFALADNNATAVTIYDRIGGKALDLVARVGAIFPACTVRQGTTDAAGHDLVINATPLGLQPDDPPAFDPASADSSALFAEVVMKPEMTPLLVAAQALGRGIHSGIHMLDGQLAGMMEFFGLAKPS